jgi:hypothetical protein
MADRPKKQSRLCVFFAQEAIHQKTRKKKNSLLICSFVAQLNFRFVRKNNCLARDAKKKKK